MKPTTSKVRPWRRLLICALTVAFLRACAGTQSRNTDPINDPWEGYNRKIHAFNMGVDRYVARPLAKGYDTVTPAPIKRGIGNFFRNLNYPVTAFNQIMQGKWQELGESTDRFLANTIFGLLGFFDIASRADLPYHREDFGQTLAVWGWKDSNYLVMPFLGPYTTRDLLGRSFYGYLHPISYAAREGVYWPIPAELIQLRSELLPLDAEIDAQYDPYVFIRDALLQRRTNLIYDGSPPELDYEALLEDFEE